MPAPRASPASTGRARSSRSPPRSSAPRASPRPRSPRSPARAGISKPLIYNYFGSKDGLYEACLDRGGALLADEIERIARGDAVGIERGLRTLDGMFTLLERQRYLWRLFFDTTAPSDGLDRRGRRPPTPTASTSSRDEGVAELMALAGNRDDLDVSAMTAVWLGIVDSLMNWWLEHPDETAEQMIAAVRPAAWQPCSATPTDLFCRQHDSAT